MPEPTLRAIIDFNNAMENIVTEHYDKVKAFYNDWKAEVEDTLANEPLLYHKESHFYIEANKSLRTMIEKKNAAVAELYKSCGLTAVRDFDGEHDLIETTNAVVHLVIWCHEQWIDKYATTLRVFDGDSKTGVRDYILKAEGSKAERHLAECHHANVWLHQDHRELFRKKRKGANI